MLLVDSTCVDTVNHKILLSRLASDFGIHGNVLKWVGSYLSNRSTRVLVEGVASQQLGLRYGVPQGSSVGPQQFTLYTTPIGDIIRQFGLSFHIYAYDIQLYTSFNSRDHASIESALLCISACIDKIKKWMTVNYLKFNEAKTEFVVASSTSKAHSTCCKPPCGQ